VWKHDRTKGYADGKVQDVESCGKPNDEDLPAGMAGDLDLIAREGARRLLVAMLDAEVAEFLGRQRYERADSGDPDAGRSGYRYERSSLLITSNLPSSEWGQIFQGERMTAALLDRLTHHCHIFEMNGESYRFRESATKAKAQGPKRPKKRRQVMASNLLPSTSRRLIL